MTWQNLTDIVAGFNQTANSIIAAFQGRPNRYTLTTFFGVTVNNLEVQFVDQTQSSVGIVSWSWDFGDGATSSAQHPSHTYAQEGDYLVTLTVTDSAGQLGQHQELVTAEEEQVEPPPTPILPQALFSVSTNGLVATFTDQSIVSEPRTISAWSWDFGERPTSAFSETITGLSVLFTDQSTIPAPLTISAWSWQFGDSSGSTQQSPTHVYATGGNKQITLQTTASNGETDTLVKTISVLSTSTGTVALGVPFGATQSYSGNQTLKSGTTRFNLTLDVVSPSNITLRIAHAASNNGHLLLYLTGGAAADYLTNGVFDSSKWTAKLNTFNTAAIKSSVASAVAAGVVLGASMIDEPFNVKWGPKGTLKKTSVDGMAAATKSLFSTLPCGVFHSYQEFEPNSSYTVIDFIIAAYWLRFGDSTTWLNNSLAMAARDNHNICFGINILDGGATIAGCGNNATAACCPQGTTEGPGTFGNSDHYMCRMIPSTMTRLARQFGPNGPGFIMWRCDDQAMSSGSWAALNQAAWEELRLFFAALPQKSWLRPS